MSPAERSCGSIRPAASEEWAQASRHAIALVAQRKRGPRRCLPKRWPPSELRSSPGGHRPVHSNFMEPALGNSQPDYYAILGVAPTATAREITHAYRSLLRRHHPDTRQADHDGGASEASDLHRLHAIMQAYVVLSDATRKHEYDRARSGSPGIGAGTPVKVRIHRTTAAKEPDAAGEGARHAPPASGPDRSEPLIFGPTRWAPLRGHSTPRRRT